MFGVGFASKCYSNVDWASKSYNLIVDVYLCSGRSDSMVLKETTCIAMSSKELEFL